MSFNFGKCKVMHFGNKNPENKYTMELGDGKPSHTILKTLVERDLGLMISNDLKWESQVDEATKSAKSIIAQIRNSFSYFDADLIRLLYVSLVRPHVEFAVSVWNPYFKKDIEKLESIQHKITRLIPKIKKKSYDERLKIVKLTKLETRRKRGDLIQFYKILNGIDHVEWRSELVRTIQGDANGPAASKLRRKGVCFHREKAGICTVREKFFLNRVIPLWNELSQETKEAKTLNSFKARLDGEKIFLAGS